MKILVEMTHPAHFNPFKNVIKELKEAGIEEEIIAIPEPVFSSPFDAGIGIFSRKKSS